MTAKEMFEKLGFEEVITQGFVEYDIFDFEHSTATISFNKDKQTVECFSFDDAMEIDMDVINAIMQQCKELGWI